MKNKEKISLSTIVRSYDELNFLFFEPIHIPKILKVIHITNSTDQNLFVFVPMKRRKRRLVAIMRPKEYYIQDYDQSREYGSFIIHPERGTLCSEGELRIDFFTGDEE